MIALVTELYCSTTHQKQIVGEDYPEDGGSKILQNVSNKLPVNIASTMHHILEHYNPED
jgi:hypothetical protein